jgi:glycosyltransferase involved in cell wall biosynthesis
MHSLWTLVRHLDSQRFEPSVLAFQDDPFWEKFEKIGIPVGIWPDASTGVRSSRRPLGFRLQPSVTRESPPSGEATGGARREKGCSGATVPSSEAYLRQPAMRRGLASLMRLVLVDLPLARRLARHVKRTHAHLLHANDRIGSNRFVALAGLLSRRPVIQHERLAAPYRWTDVLLSGWTSATIFVSSQVADYAREQGHRGHRLLVIPNAVETLGIIPAVPAEHPPVIGIVGRLVEWKGQDLFLEAMARLAPRHAQASFVVVGTASERSLAYEQALRERARQVPLDSRVRFTGHVPEPLSLMREMSIVVVASRSPEPFGRTLIEAMSLGVPVVAPDAGGPAEIVEHERTGLLYAPNDAGGLAAAVERLLAHPEWARRLGEAGRQAVEARYRPEAHARAVEGVYDEVLAGDVL